jgi:hypothetical protein
VRSSARAAQRIDDQVAYVKTELPGDARKKWNDEWCAKIVSFPLTKIVSKYGNNMCNKIVQIGARLTGWCAQALIPVIGGAAPIGAAVTSVCGVLTTSLFVNRCTNFRDQLLGHANNHIVDWTQDNICSQDIMRLPESKHTPPQAWPATTYLLQLTY